MKFTFPNIQTHPRDPLLLTYPLFLTYPIHHSLYSYFSHTQSIILSILIFHFLFLVSLLPLFRGKVVASDFRCVSRFCSRLVLIFLFLLFPSSAGTFHGFFLKKKKTNSRSVSAQIGPYWAESETKKKKKISHGHACSRVRARLRCAGPNGTPVLPNKYIETCFILSLERSNPRCNLYDLLEV